MVDRDAYLTLDLALRVGEMLLANGAGAADVHHGMRLVTRSCGMSRAQPSVTFTDLTISWQPHIDEPAIVQTRHVTHREIDQDDLTRVDHVIRELVHGRIDRDEARRRMLESASAGHLRKRWAVTLGWGVMSVGVAMMLGGTPLVWLLAFVSAVLIDRATLAMSRRWIPTFYQQVVGGLIATLIAVAVALADLPVEPSRVVTAGIVMLLAGLGLVGAVQDALIGYPLTATARLLEVAVSTIGIVAGVSAGLTIGRMLGLEVGQLAPPRFRIEDVWLVLAGGALAAAGFVYASYGRKRTLLPIAAVAVLGVMLQFSGDVIGIERIWSTTLGAIAVGMLSYAAAGRFRVPPLAVMVSGLVPLLPGLQMYRGLALISSGGSGAGDVVGALATALAIAAGAIGGQYLAQPMRTEARRIERHLRGPHLVGPVRLPRIRRRG